MDAPIQGLDSQGDQIPWDLYRPLETCYNSCFCKKCCFHCQLCFLRKGLGITYAKPRRRVKKKAKANPFDTSNQSISSGTRNCQPKKEQKEKVETEVDTDCGLGR
ncbi:tat protein [Simian immunodeficiency virus]|uniref:Protein Tat n=1 Tax=Simian immunodeficiency virus TaxID=11723 RepID=Q90DC8_SIV|nr:tat protein [Simian immunodeficiency virus]